MNTCRLISQNLTRELFGHAMQDIIRRSQTEFWIKCRYSLIRNDEDVMLFTRSVLQKCLKLVLQYFRGADIKPTLRITRNHLLRFNRHLMGAFIFLTNNRPEMPLEKEGNQNT